MAHDPETLFSRREAAEEAIEQAVAGLESALEILQASGDSDVRPALIKAQSQLDQVGEHLVEAQGATKIKKSLEELTPEDHLKQISGDTPGTGRYVGKERSRRGGGDAA